MTSAPPTLGAAPPALAGVGRHRQLDPQRLAAAGRVVDGGVHHLVDGVQQAGDVLAGGGHSETAAPPAAPQPGGGAETILTRRLCRASAGFARLMGCRVF